MPRKKSEAKASDKKSPKKPQEKSQDAVMEIQIPEGSSFVMPVVILVSALIVAVAIIYTGSKLTDTGSTLGSSDSGSETADNSGSTGSEDVVAETPGDVLGDFETFTEYDTEICKEDGKPVVYLFSTTWCPHCEWIKDTFDSWAKDNADKAVVYHWELDTNDNTLTDAVETEVPAEHQAVYEQFNPNGSIPTFVFGCKYSRVGNGYEAQDDLDAERDSFDKVLEELI